MFRNRWLSRTCHQRRVSLESVWFFQNIYIYISFDARGLGKQLKPFGWLYALGLGCVCVSVTSSTESLQVREYIWKVFQRWICLRVFTWTLSLKNQNSNSIDHGGLQMIPKVLRQTQKTTLALYIYIYHISHISAWVIIHYVVISWVWLQKRILEVKADHHSLPPCQVCNMRQVSCLILVGVAGCSCPDSLSNPSMSVADEWVRSPITLWMQTLS